MGAGTESCNAICLTILDKSCKYCKLSYSITDDEIFEFCDSNKHRSQKIKFMIGQDELYEFIFVNYIQSNLNMDATVIVVSDYLNKH